MARQKKPAALARREGNPGKRKITETWAARGAPPPPDELNADGLDFWETVIGPLGDLGVLDPVDAPVLFAWATAYERFVAAKRIVDMQGYATYGSMGQPTENPMIAVMERGARDCLRFANEFGATAAARSRIDAVRGKAPLDVFAAAIGESPRLRAVK